MAEFGINSVNVITKMSSDSTKPRQKSILGFFQQRNQGLRSKSPARPASNGTKTLPIGSPKKQSVSKRSARPSQTLTPAPSSDAVAANEDDEDVVVPAKSKRATTGLPSPVTPIGLDGALDEVNAPNFTSSPSRKVCSNPALPAGNAEHVVGKEEDQLCRVSR